MRPEQQHGSKASHDPAPDTERATGTAARSQRREAVWRLQQRFGNRRSQVIQAKLAVGPVDDPLEREADHIAAHALGSSVHREPADVQQVPLAAGGTVEPAVEAAISRAVGGGHAVPAGVRERMEHATGADLSDVRVHVGSETDRMNDALGARAFTVGSDVFVRRSEYRPGTSEGDALLGHELAHTVQQGAAGPEVARSPRTTQVQRDPIPADEWEERTLDKGTIVYHATPLKFAGKLFQGPIRSAQDEYDAARTNPVYPDVNGWLAETYPEVQSLWPSYESALGYGFYTHLYRDEAVVGMSTVKTEGDSGWGVLFEYEVKENLTVRRLPEKGYEYHSLGNPDDYIQAADVIGGPNLGSVVGADKKRIVYATHAEMKFHNPQDHLKFLGVRWFLNPTGNAPDIEFGTTRYGHPKDLVKAIQEMRDMTK